MLVNVKVTGGLKRPMPKNFLFESKQLIQFIHFIFYFVFVLFCVQLAWSMKLMEKHV